MLWRARPRIVFEIKMQGAHLIEDNRIVYYPWLIYFV